MRALWKLAATDAALMFVGATFGAMLGGLSFGRATLAGVVAVVVRLIGMNVIAWARARADSRRHADVDEFARRNPTIAIRRQSTLGVTPAQLMAFPDDRGPLAGHVIRKGRPGTIIDPSQNTNDE